MKIMLHLALIIAFQLTYSQTRSISGDSWEKVKTNKSGVLTCLWNEAYGIVYVNQNNELKGVCVDILNDFVLFLKEKHGINITLKFKEEKVFINFLQQVSTSPNVLGVSSVSITDERKKTLRFSNPFLKNPNIIVTNRETQKLSRLEDMSNLFAGVHAKVVEGSMHYQYALELKKKYFSNLVIETGPTSKDILEEIVNNKNMFSIIDFAEYYGAVRNKLNLVRQNVHLDFVDNMGFTMSKKSDWAPIWDEFLNKDYLSSVRYKKLVSENMGSSYFSLIVD